MITSFDELFEFLDAGLVKIPRNKAILAGYIESMEFRWWITAASAAVYRAV